jgi:hypothetical protein
MSFLNSSIADFSRRQNMTAENKRMLTALFREHVNAQTAYEQLLHRGYHDDEITMLMSDTTRSTYFVVRDSFDFVMAGQPIEPRLLVEGPGAEIAPHLATVMAAGNLVPMSGMVLITAGPIATAKSDLEQDELISHLTDFGLPSSTSELYEDALRESGIVVGVSPHSAADAQTVRREFEHLHGEGLAYCRCRSAM